MYIYIYTYTYHVFYLTITFMYVSLCADPLVSSSILGNAVLHSRAKIKRAIRNRYKFPLPRLLNFTFNWNDQGNDQEGYLEYKVPTPLQLYNGIKTGIWRIHSPVQLYIRKTKKMMVMVVIMVMIWLVVSTPLKNISQLG